MTLTVSAEVDTVSVVVSDSVKVDSIKPKKQNFFKRAYYFMDRILSPPRDRRYIDVQDYYNWCAMLQMSTKLEMYQMDQNDGNFLLNLTPTPHLRLGPFFGWRFAFLGYNIDLKSLFLNSGDIDLGGSIYSSAFGLDLFYRRVGNSFNINKLQIDGQDLTNYLHGEPFDGMNLGMTRVSFYYIPNYKHYSHQAAFSQTHRQLISAGSIILGVQYAHNRFDIDWAALLEKMKKYEPSIELPTSARNGLETSDEFTATVGYGYNWVFHKNWLLGSEITGSVGYLRQDNNTEIRKSSGKTVMEQAYHKNIALNGSLRFCLLYNSGPIYTGLQGVSFYYQHGNGQMMYRNLLATFYVFVGYNF